MIKNTQIKAMNEEEAKKRALNILDAMEYQITEIKMLEKPKSFLGLFSKNGLFEVYVDTDKLPEKPKKVVEKVEKPAEKTNKKVGNPSKEKGKKEEKEEKIKEHKPAKKAASLENDEIIEKIKTLIQKIDLQLEVQYEKINDKHYQIHLLGEDNGIIIGKKGKTLNSFEYLVNSMYKDYKIEIDVEGFKEKRIHTLRDLGKKMAEKCIKTKKTIRLNTMPPKERKIIHEILNTYPELETYSEGRDPKRYIVIKYKKR